LGDGLLLHGIHPRDATNPRRIAFHRGARFSAVDDDLEPILETLFKIVDIAVAAQGVMSSKYPAEEASASGPQP
jgi:hypothetical protein